MVRYAVRCIAVVAVVCLAAGCADATEDPRDAADRFESAVADGDAAAACRLLAAATLEEVEQSSGQPCEDALLEDVEEAGPAEDVSRFGTMAQVRYRDDVLFLTRGSAGWQVYAAACRPSGPTYDCQVSGG